MYNAWTGLVLWLIAGSSIFADGYANEGLEAVIEESGPSPPASSLQLLDAPTFIVDSSSGASAVIQLKNKGAGPLKIALSASDFVSATTGLGLGAKTTFSVPPDATGKRVYEVELPPGKLLSMDVQVTNLWEAGESKAELLNDGERIGTLKAQKYRVPFAIKLSNAVGDPPAISLRYGIQQPLLLKNDDAMTYQAHWEMSVDSQSMSGGPIKLPPSDTEKLVITVPSESASGLSSLFKPETRDGVLTLRFSSSTTASAAPISSKTIPVKLRLSYWSPWQQDFLSNSMIFLVLLAGGVCSLIVSQWVPNRLRRRDIREQLRELAKTTRELSEKIDSSLRVLVRVQRKRLDHLLHSRWIMSPDMAGVFTRCGQGISLLNKQLELIRRIDVAYIRLHETEAAAPTLLDEISDGLHQAETRLNDSAIQESGLQEVQSLITATERRLATIHQTDSSFGERLADRVKTLRPLFADKDKPPGGEEFKALWDTRPHLQTVLVQEKEDPARILAADYAEIDANLCRLELILDYVRASTGTVDTARKRIKDHESELLGLIDTTSSAALKHARKLVAQMREGVFMEDIQAAIVENEKKLSINMDPPQAQANWPMRWTVKFADPKLADAAARYCFKCLWDFGDNLKEPGWEVSHYFEFKTQGMWRPNPAPGSNYTVKVSFLGPEGMLEANGKPVVLEKPVEVRPDTERLRDRFWTEVIRLSIVLVVALFALMAGARDQLLKLDLVPGLLAVFAVGFGADTVKNLLVPRPQ